MTKSRAEELKHLMEHPVFIMHDGSAKIIRAQLFFLSISTIILIASGMTVGEDSSILGISLKGLTLNHLLWVLTGLIFYQMLHFLWTSWESFCEWRLRQSALDTGGFGGGGIKIHEENGAQKVRQTTLYYYMTDLLDHDLINLGKKIKSLSENDSPKEMDKIEKLLQRICDIVAHSRVDNAMWRFDSWFKMFCKSQNFRWLFLETLLPLVLGVCAISLATCKVLVH